MSEPNPDLMRDEREGLYRVWYRTPAGGEGFMSVEATDSQDAWDYVRLTLWRENHFSHAHITGIRWLRPPLLRVTV